MRTRSGLYGVVLFLSFFTFFCDFNELDEINTPQKDFWTNAPVYAGGSKEIIIQSGEVLMGGVGGESEFSAGFTIEDLESYTIAELSVSFEPEYLLLYSTDLSGGPVIAINNRDQDSSLKNSNAVSSENCLDVIEGLGWAWYYCPFTTEINVINDLSEGSNTFQLRVQATDDNKFFFKDVKLTLTN